MSKKPKATQGQAGSTGPPSNGDPPITGRQSTAAGLPRRHFLNEMPDKGLFGFVAVFGFGLIIALKLYDYNSDIVAGLAVALMVVYGLIAYRIPDVHIRLDRLGDNFYYLGFIFTLGSMSAALIQLRNNPNIEAILGSFGIALFTTIVGVAGRVLFTQMRTEIDEVEALVRRDVLEAANNLKAQLSLSLRDFQTFHQSVHQVSTETLSRIDAAIDKEVSQVGNAARLVAEQVSEAFKANQTQAQALLKAIADISASVEELTKRLASVELPTERIQRQLGSMGDELERLLRRVSASLEEMAKALNDMKPPTRRIEEQIEAFGAEIERRLLTRLAEVVEEAEKASRARWWFPRR
jgi:methyl-accepting chemotaxis protein